MTLTAERARELLRYDPESGEVIWIAKPNRNIVVGSVAGRMNTDGYRRIGVGGRQYPAHRVAWLLAHGAWPAGVIDHINGRRDDNRLSNLRVVTHVENCQNQRQATARNKSSGLLGAAWAAYANKWRATIKVGGHTTNLGYHDTAEAAHASYVEAKRRLHAGSTL